MFTCDLYAGVFPQMSPPPHDRERLRTTMVDFIVMETQCHVVEFVRVGYFIPLNGPLNGHPPSNQLYQPNYNCQIDLCKRGHNQLFPDDERHVVCQLLHSDVIIVVNIDLEMPPPASSQASKFPDCICPQCPDILKVDEMATFRHHINEFGI